MQFFGKEQDFTLFQRFFYSFCRSDISRCCFSLSFKDEILFSLFLQISCRSVQALLHAPRLPHTHSDKAKHEFRGKKYMERAGVLWQMQI